MSSFEINLNSHKRENKDEDKPFHPLSTLLSKLIRPIRRLTPRPSDAAVRNSGPPNKKNISIYDPKKLGQEFKRLPRLLTPLDPRPKLTQANQLRQPCCGSHTVWVVYEHLPDSVCTICPLRNYINGNWSRLCRF